MQATAPHPSHRSDDFSRGFGVLLFRNRSMGRALTFYTVLLSLLWLFLILAGIVVLHSQRQIGAALTYLWASFLVDVVGRDVGQWPVWTSGGWEKWPPSAIIAEPWFQDVAGDVGHSLLWSLLVATVVTVPLGIVVHRAIKSFGRRMLTGKYLRGAVKVSDEELARQVRKKRQATPLAHRQGAAAGGQRVRASGLHRWPRHRQDPGDPGPARCHPCARRCGRHLRQQGHLHEPLLRPERGDVLLNPLDARTRPWSPWAEIEDEMDADRVAHALIPAGDHSTPFFHDTARAMLSAALMQMRGMRGNEPALERLLQLLLHASSDEREAFYRGTDVTQIYDKGGERMRVSVEQNLRTYVRTLRYLPLTAAVRTTSRSCATSRASTAVTGSRGCSCPRRCAPSTPRSSPC